MKDCTDWLNMVWWIGKCNHNDLKELERYDRGRKAEVGRVVGKVERGGFGVEGQPASKEQKDEKGGVKIPRGQESIGVDEKGE